MSTIIVRVDAKTKQRLVAAAQARGQSLTTFLLKAANDAAGKEPKMNTVMQKPKGKGVCPTYFLARCVEASRGGENNYAGAGNTLLSNIADEASWDYSPDEWSEKLDKLESMLAARLRDDDAVLAWFDLELPRCMKLVPRRRREQFLKGVYERFDEAGIER